MRILSYLKQSKKIITERTLQSIHDHKEILLEKATSVVVENDKAMFYKGDFRGLLKHELGIDEKYHEVIFMINGFNNAQEYNGDINLLVVDTSTIENIVFSMLPS